MSKHCRRLLDEMAPILVENKRLQTSVNDLDASLTRACHQEELELQVLKLETKNQSLTERLRHVGSQ